MATGRSRSLLIGSSPSGIAYGLFGGLGGSVLLAWSPLKNFPELGVSLVVLAAVMSRYGVGILPTSIALFPPLYTLYAGCGGDFVACEPLETALLGSAVYGSIGFFLGRGFAWMRQSASRSEVFISLGRVITGPGVVGLLIAMVMPRNGSVSLGLLTIQLDYGQELLLILSMAVILVGLFGYAVGKVFDNSSDMSWLPA